MNTPLELHALQQMSDLQAATLLTGRTRGELLAVCALLHLRPKRGAESSDLVALILGSTHPRPATTQVAAQYEQTRFV